MKIQHELRGSLVTSVYIRSTERFFYMRRKGGECVGFDLPVALHIKGGECVGFDLPVALDVKGGECVGFDLPFALDVKGGE